MPARAGDYATGYTGFHTSLDRRPIAAGRHARHVGGDRLHEHRGGPRPLHRGAPDGRRPPAHRRVEAAAAARRLAEHADQAGVAPATGWGWWSTRSRAGARSATAAGSPGYITYTLLLVEDGIALSVLTNAVDGPAAQLALGVAKLLDGALGRPARACRSPRPRSRESPARRRPASRAASRTSGAWSTSCGSATACSRSPPARPIRWTASTSSPVVDDATLRITAGDGFGSVGELVRYQFDAAGNVTSIRGFSGMTLWPFDLQGARRSPRPGPRRLHAVPKIAFIGAGSVEFTRNLVGDILAFPELARRGDRAARHRCRAARDGGRRSRGWSATASACARA